MQKQKNKKVKYLFESIDDILSKKIPYKFYITASLLTLLLLGSMVYDFNSQDNSLQNSLKQLDEDIKDDKFFYDVEQELERVELYYNLDNPNVIYIRNNNNFEVVKLNE